MNTQIAALKRGRNTLILLALIVFSPAGACNRAAPIVKSLSHGADDLARGADDLTRGADDLTRGADDLTRGTSVIDNLPPPSAFGSEVDGWAENYRLDRSALYEGICNGIARVLREDLPMPNDWVASVAGDLITRSIEDRDAQAVASEAVSWILGQGQSLPDWYNANCDK